MNFYVVSYFKTFSFGYKLANLKLFFFLGNGLLDFACFCFSAACWGLDVLANVDDSPTPLRVEQSC